MPTPWVMQVVPWLLLLSGIVYLVQALREHGRPRWQRTTTGGWIRLNGPRPRPHWERTGTDDGWVRVDRGAA